MRTDVQQAADIYRDTVARITELLVSQHVWTLPVAACPGWSVRDVVSHMAAVAQDWAEGRLAGAPTDEETAEHVRRFDGIGEIELLEIWTDAAASLHDLAETTGLEPPLGDVACHEHDIRSAIGEPGARDAESVIWISDRLLRILQTPAPVRIVVEDTEYRVGPPGEPEIILRTTRFETLRWRTGRRSRAQLAAMDWSSDPSSVLDHLYLFGPAVSDLVE